MFQCSKVLNDFLKGLTELRKIVMLSYSLLYIKRIQIKTSNGKRCIEQTPGETKYKLSVLLSQWIHVDSLILPHNNV